jgi:hypothetical protein
MTKEAANISDPAKFGGTNLETEIADEGERVVVNGFAMFNPFHVNVWLS